MEQSGAIESACRYPVKSMAGEDVAEAFVGFAGVMGDRAWAFLRTSTTTKGFPWHTGREQHTLVRYRPRSRQVAATKLPVDIASSFAMAPGVNAVFSVLFTPAYVLVQELLSAKRDLQLPRALRKLDLSR